MLRAAWHWGDGSGAANDPLGAPGSTLLYLCLPHVRVCVGGDLFPHYLLDRYGGNKTKTYQRQERWGIQVPA
jgi:hypothetical protein